MEDKVDTFGEAWIEEVLLKGEKQVKLELRDYWNLMQTHSKLLDRVTKGRMSKTNYTWEAIEGVLNELDTDVLEGEHGN